MNCKWCNKLLTGWDYDNTFKESFCDKLHRLEYEKINTDRNFLGNFVVLKDRQYKDRNGESVWFPKDGKPYFDKALRRTFNNVHEKMAFMDEHNLVMHGSESPKRWPVESGDMRSRSYRKQTRTED